MRRKLKHQLPVKTLYKRQKKGEDEVGREKYKQKKWGKIRGYLYDFGKLFVDISKLVFASLVLGNIMRRDFSPETVFNWGTVFSAVTATVGIIMARIFKEE